MSAERNDAGPALTAEQRLALLELARGAVGQVAAAAGPPPAPENPGAPPPGLDRPGAAFVTLRVGGTLRGCIGACEPHASLWSTVHEMASAAATRDPRFPPITARDLDDLSVEISVLSPERVIHDASEIEIGRHGLEVRRRMARGLLLPQVATEHRFDRERFLAETCRKAGLPPDAWRDPATEVWLFEADVFSEADG